VASATQSPGLTLKVKRTFQAPVEKVWAAWTERGPLEQWMCRDQPEHLTKYREFDFREGGRYEIENKTAGGVFLGSGTYEEIRPLEKIVFSWEWEQHAKAGSKTKLHQPTRVTVEFHRRGTATEVLLTHTLLPNEKEVASHKSGWNGCFDKLAEYLKD
jgi:uncharacterized protein YndB with AHSA1/START domain